MKRSKKIIIGLLILANAIILGTDIYKYKIFFNADLLILFITIITEISIIIIIGWLLLILINLLIIMVQKIINRIYKKDTKEDRKAIMNKLLRKKELIILTSVFILGIMLGIILGIIKFEVSIEEGILKLFTIGIIGWLTLILIKSVIEIIKKIRKSKIKRFFKYFGIGILILFILVVTIILTNISTVKKFFTNTVVIEIASDDSYTGGPQPIKDIEVKVSKEEIGDTRRIIVDLTIIPAIENVEGYIHFKFSPELKFINKKEFNYEYEKYIPDTTVEEITIRQNTNIKKCRFIFEIKKNQIDNKQILSILRRDGLYNANTININIKNLVISKSDY